MQDKTLLHFQANRGNRLPHTTPQGDAKSIIKTHGKHKKVVLRKKNAPPKEASVIRFASTCFSIGYKN